MRYILIYIILLIVFSDRGQASPKFIAQNNILLFLGQDMGAIGGFDAPDNDGYYENVGIVAAGITFYTSIPKLNGINEIDNWGSGNSCGGCIVKNPIYKNSSLAIGLYIVNQLDSINAGHHDKRIDSLANWIKTTNKPVFLRIGYEFDGEWNSYNPDKYKLSFKRIVDRFRNKSVENCVFVWQSSGRYDSTYLLKWYPGDDYVDWMGYSHFDNKGDGILNLARSHKKPVMIAESTPKRTLSQGKAKQHWDGWFAPFFKHIYDNSDVIKCVAYINVNWNAQPIWKNQGWGDSRVEANDTIKQWWIDEIKKPIWLQASDTLFKKMNYSLSTTELETFLTTTDIKVFPNPVENEIFFEILTPEEIKKIEIHTLEGVLVRSIYYTSSKGNKIDVSQLKSGVYVLTFTTTYGQKRICKVVKNT